jgi:DNA-directed RNA polymerase
MSERIRDMFISLHQQDLIGKLRDEFLDRYGDYRIPVKSAQAISLSVATKRSKDLERRKQIAGLLGEDIESPIVAAAVDGEDIDVTTALSEAGDEVEDELDDDLEHDAPSTERKKRAPNALALSAADLASLAAKLGGDVPQEQLGDQKFVRFKDVLSPTPARGSFDVSRIRDSAYFFS